ncbi:MAG: hypothetical protein NTZ34_12310, partial [Chloroflexi bacterium]|nr:hypothetical protein [Chloroflexota bacterium]
MKNHEMNLESLSQAIGSLEDHELFELKVKMDAEMARRGISFDVGHMGEMLVIDYFNKTKGLPKLYRSAVGVTNVDANSRDGDRYSIKTYLKAKKTGTIYPDQDQKKQLFEYLVIVHLSSLYELQAIYRYSWKDFQSV